MDAPGQYRRVAAAALASVALAGSGCFSPSFEQCAVTCGAEGECPENQFCLSDGKCHKSQEEELCRLTGDRDGSAPDGPIGGDGGVRFDAGDGGGDRDGGLDAGPPVTPTEPGSLVISEIHKDPFEAPDPNGEWFEVFNPTDQNFDLQGLLVVDDGVDFFNIKSSVILPPGGRVVFAREADPDVNGGVEEDYAYGKNFTLGNDDDEIAIVNVPANEVVLDRVAYVPEEFPDLQGASLSLDANSHTASQNDIGLNWCDGVTLYGAGDLGTPGEINPTCP